MTQPQQQPMTEEQLRAEVTRLIDAYWGLSGHNLPEKRPLYVDAIMRLFQSLASQETERLKITGDTSDGYHTFNGLYHFRMLYNAALFNDWSGQGRYFTQKSKRHSDGELCFGGGWFVVVATLPTGQITNHYQLEYWDLFDVAIVERADEWDGHTPADVAKRLEAYLRGEQMSQMEEGK